jgi:hypothetical protein
MFDMTTQKTQANGNVAKLPQIKAQKPYGPDRSHPQKAERKQAVGKTMIYLSRSIGVSHYREVR